MSVFYTRKFIYFCDCLNTRFQFKRINTNSNLKAIKCGDLSSQLDATAQYIYFSLIETRTSGSFNAKKCPKRGLRF